MPHCELKSGWSLRGEEGGRVLGSVPAAVPGSVHLDLLRAGLIDDPRIGAGVLRCRWVENCRWSYLLDFDSPADAMAPATRRTWLVFETADREQLEVELNGERVAFETSAANPCRIDVTGRLRTAQNRLIVRLRPIEAADLVVGSLPQYRLGTDWSPRLIPQGLRGTVRLEWTHLPLRASTPCVTATLDEDLGTGHVGVRQSVEVLGEHPARVTLLAQIPEAGAIAEVHADLPPGPGVIETTLTVPKPRVWHPAGHGAQTLHTLMTTVIANGHDVQRGTTAIGFRHVAVDDPSQALARRAAEPQDRSAAAFPFVRVNGQRIFCKAATLVPADLLEADHAEHLKLLMDLAADAHLNALVLPIDAGPLPDAFYDLADRNGVLLFQETAWTDLAPGAIRRVASHPSLVAWCTAGDQQAIRAADPSRAVIANIEAYPLTPGPAAPATVRAALGEERASNASAALARGLHDCAPDVGPPSAPPPGGGNSCQAAVALGEALSALIETVRRQAPATAGLHLHRLNDCWPATRTRALIDHGLRRTPAWYYARRALAPIHITLAVEAEEVVVFGLNDTSKIALGDLRFGVVQLDGMFVINRSVRVQLAPATCTRLVTFPLGRWRDRHRSVAFAVLARMNRTVARNCLAVTPTDQLRWPTPNVQTQLIAQQVTFTSPTFARGVCLDDTGEVPLSDNYFDVYPGIPHTIPWNLPHVPKVVYIANA